MKNKKRLIPLIAGGVLIAGLSAFILLYKDDQKVSSPTELKTPVFKDDSYNEQEKKEIYDIDRTELDLTGLYEVIPSDISSVKAMTGTRFGAKNITFTKLSFGGESLDIDYINPSLLRIGKYGDALVVEAPNIFQFIAYKISDSASTRLIGNDVEVQLSTKYDDIKAGYVEECKKKATFDKMDVYNDSRDGGILTYTPMAKFIKENSLEKEVGVYSYSAYKKILNKFFTVPEGYTYMAGTEWKANSFGRTGVFKPVNDMDMLGHELYYLIYSDKGVYACKLFYESNKNKAEGDSNTVTETNLLNTVLPSHMDKDFSTIGKDDADYKENKEITKTIALKDFAKEEIKTLEGYDREINGRIYIDIPVEESIPDSVRQEDTAENAETAQAAQGAE